MLAVYQSNRLERLVEQLAEVVDEPQDSVLAPETIVVHSQGMARWLSLRLADRLGICANLRFPFPAAFIWDVFRVTLPRVPAEPPYDPKVLTWRIRGLLPQMMTHANFEPVLAYLHQGDDLKSFELSRRVAETLDQYMSYRPDWIRDWEAGQQGHWQAMLWRRLVASIDGVHGVTINDEFAKALDNHLIETDNLPSRVSLFGITVLSPSYLEVLARLAELIDIHLFLLNPSRQYWGDIIPQRGIGRRAGDRPPEELYLESGNSLLASFGQQGRDFIDMLQDYQVVEHDLFEDVDEDTLLHCIQADILDLRERGSDAHAETTVAQNDYSIQIHSCHSPMREVEVLYDQLLHLLETYPELVPAQIMVMTPDIEAYAPYVEAIFGTAAADRHIPFTIADRELRTQSPVVASFFELFELVESRFDVNRVMGLLESEAVQNRFGLSGDALGKVIKWVRDTGIRWGVDARDRVKLGLPEMAENTWRSGMDRLLLGYAMPSEAQRLFKGIAPYDEVEGANAQLMGRLQTYVEAVIALRNELLEPRPAIAWSQRLRRVLERFFAPRGTDEQSVQTLREALDELERTVRLADYQEPISLDVVKSFLDGQLKVPSFGRGFLSGRVTFCQMMPMRSIPFDVICLIGMNDGGFPRSRRPYGFDLMAHEFRRGDRSRRDDDRYLFLEAMLSARQCLYLSYVGQDIRDNSVIPPSVVVSEILDYVERGFVCNNQADGLARLVTHHPLQAFSRRYFAKERGLFSYSQALCEASRWVGAQAPEPGAFIAQALPQPETEWRTVELDQLLQFVKHPTRYLLRERLGTVLEERQEFLETREPFRLIGLDRYGLCESLLQYRLHGDNLHEMLPLLRARGEIPHGQVGASVMRKEFDRLEGFARRIETLLPVHAIEPIEIDLVYGDMRLIGWLENVAALGLIAYRPGKINAKDRLSLWVRHLVLNLLSPAEVEKTSRWIGDDNKAFMLQSVDGAAQYLEVLLELYWQGLSRPIHFFPESAYAYAKAYVNNKPAPMMNAVKIWRGNDIVLGEFEDVYYELAFRHSDPLDDEFTELSLEVFEPLLQYAEE